MFQTLGEGKVEGNQLVVRVFDTDSGKQVGDSRFKPRV